MWQSLIRTPHSSLPTANMKSDNDGDNNNNNDDDDKLTSFPPDDLVSRWLTAANLAYAIPNFQMAGIVSPRSFAELELSYFEPLGVTKSDDRKRLFYLIQKVKGEIEKTKKKKKQKSKSLVQESRRDERGDEDHRAGTSFQSPVISKVDTGRNNAGNHAHYLDHDEGDDYDDVIVSTVGSDTISPVTLASQIASLSEEIQPGNQNHGGGGRTAASGREKNAGTASRALSVLDKEKDFMERVNFETNIYQPTATTSSSKKKLTAREQLERELELRASKRREQKLMDQRQQKQHVREMHHQDQHEDTTKLEELSTTKSITSTAGGGSKKRRQSFLPSVRSSSGEGGSNSSIVDVRSRRSSVGIHRRETVRKTNTTLSVAAAAAGRGVRVVGRGVNKSVEEADMSETSDLSASVSSYHPLEGAALYRRKSNASVSTIGTTTATPSELSGRSVHYHGGSACFGAGDDDYGMSSVSRMGENRNGNVGAGSSGGMKSHSSRTKRLSTIPSSMIAPLSPLVEFSSTQPDESMADVGQRNLVRRRSSLGCIKTPASASHSTADSTRSQKKLGGGAKSPGSTSISSYPSRPSSRTSQDGSQRVKINKLNISHSSHSKANTSVLSSSSVASSVRRRRQHLMSPTNVGGKNQQCSLSRSKSPVPSSSHSSIQSQQERSALSTRSRSSRTTSYATASSPKRDVSPKKMLSPPKSGLIVSNSRRPLSPIRNNSPAMSRAASPMSTRRVRSPTGGDHAFYKTNEIAVDFHQTTTEESWAAQIGRLRESFESEHAQYLATNDHTTNNDGDEDTEHGMRIRVIVRKRPMSKRESSEGAEVDVVQPLVYNDHGRILIHQPKTKLDLTKEVETTSFAFDNAFDERSNNIDIYEQAVQSLIPGLFRGKWASVFAYGQTGSGKTVRIFSVVLSRGMAV